MPGAPIELIVINDGSADGSLSLLKKLAEKSPAWVDMRVFTQENAGICAARNRALDLSTGDYVFFMDQDDRMKKDCVESLVSLLEQESADMVIGGYALVDEKGRVLDRWKLDSRLPWHKYRISAPWGRVFRREIIEKNHVRFMQTRISEDYYFNLVYMSCCRKIYVTPYIGYAWTYRAASESHTGMRRLEEDRSPLPMMTQALRDMKQPNALEPDLLEYMFLKHIVWYLLYTAKGVPQDALRKNYDACMDWLKANFPEYAKNKNLSYFGPKGESAKVRGVVRTAVLLERAGLLFPFLRAFSKV